jgi:hypothetical protein
MYYPGMFDDRPPVRTRDGQETDLHQGALRNLSFIRDTMERSASFTGVPGWGGVAIGIIGLVAAAVASTQATTRLWLMVWISAAIIALLVTIWATARKARRLGIPVLSGAGRKFTIGMAPSLITGTVLTIVFYANGIASLLPGVWLLLFGAAVLTAGITSVPVIRVMGVCFMVLGASAFLLPTQWGDILMAVGFGGLNMTFGFIIARKYGG